MSEESSQKSVIEPPEGGNEFRPHFSLNNLAFLEYVSNERFQSTLVTEEQFALEKERVERVLSREGKITDSHIRGFCIISNMIIIPERNFRAGYLEIAQNPQLTNAEREFQEVNYIINMQRRDLFIQFMNVVHMIYQQPHLGMPTEPYGVKESEDIVDFYTKLEEYKQTNPEYQSFLGEVTGFHLLHLSPSERLNPSDQKTAIQKAGVGIRYFMYFNQIFPEGHPTRNNVLKGLAVPPELFHYTDLHNEESVNKLLAHPERTRISKTIADFFTEFNEHPW